MSDTVHHPKHYGGDTTYEAIKVISAWGLNFSLGSALKYLCRMGKKPGHAELEDLKKARWYVDWEIKRIEPQPLPTDAGQRLYEIYCREFQTLFAPKWEDLTENSKRVWTDVATGALVGKGEA